METKLNKKLLLILLKFMPWMIGIIYLIQIILSCFGIQLIWLTIIFGISIIPAILLCMMSNLLGFCIWHRLPLYYVVTIDLINAYDFYIGIPITNKYMLLIYLIIFGLFVLIGAYNKNKYNVNKRHIENNIT